MPQRTTSNEPAALATPTDAGTWHASSPNGGRSGPRSIGTKIRWRIGLSLVLVAVGVWATFVFGSGGSGLAPGPISPARPTSFPAVAFQFPVIERGVIRAIDGKGSTEAARGAIEGVRTTLSGFYATAFLDPATWKGGTPDELWGTFRSDIRAAARDDAGSFTLGQAAQQVGSLSSSSSSIGVTIFFDPSGHAQAATATVVFSAAGELKTGSTLSVTSRATFLLERQGRRWLIVGYPSARTDVDATPAPSSAPLPTATASASPSDGGAG